MMRAVRANAVLGLGLMMLGFACATAEAAAPVGIEPMQAIFLAADAQGAPVAGNFVLQVNNVARSRRVYLNSERDYRDQRNVSVVMTQAVAADVERALGQPLEAALEGQCALVVDGQARRTRVDFSYAGRPSGKYYYRTQITVRDASQVQLC